MKEFLRILKYARPYLPKLLFGFFLILIIAQSQLVMPLVQRFVIDGILSDVRATELTHSVFGYHLTYSPTYWLIVILSSIIIFNALVGLISYVRTVIMEWVSQRILFDMRNQVFSHFSPGAEIFPVLSAVVHRKPRFPLSVLACFVRYTCFVRVLCVCLRFLLTSPGIVV